MQLQIHALRFADDDDERALKKPFNSQPSKFDIEPGVEVTIKAKDGVAMVQIGNDTPYPVSLAEYDYTAVALTYK
ncbi:MAG: hypothetical protein ACJ8BW_00600 [Ktedonobacteraceae bacterium]